MRVQPLRPAEVLLAERQYPEIRAELPAIVAAAKAAVGNHGEAATFARLAHAISSYDHEMACRIGAAAILQLAEAAR